jgi:hypothetical protein
VFDRPALRRVLRIASAAGVILASQCSTAFAATGVQTNLSEHQAEVGDNVQVELSAMSDTDDVPQNPRLELPPGFSARGPNVSSSQQISIMNGTFQRRRGITATWVIAATRPGRYVIGPASVQVGTGRLSGQTMRLDIVARGSLTQRRQRSPFGSGGFDPFSLFPQFPKLPNLDDLNDQPLLNAPPQAPGEFALEAAPDATAFLRATVSPTHAVVGQQMTLSIYAYGSRGAFEETYSSEPSRADFVSHVVVDNSFRQPRFMVPIGGTEWTAVKVREVALFPLRAGTLAIGPMRMGFRGPRYPETKPLEGLVRYSPELRVTVSEPPVAGRPPGYEVGDVGQFSLTAEVDPRRIEAGSAVGVSVRLEGTGNLPRRVRLPERRDVEWLTPTTTEALTHNDSIVGGWRQFKYVVRLTEAGTVDLGEVTLPYYNARAGRYEVARARLGTVSVDPGAAPPAPAPSGSAAKQNDSPRDPFEGLGGPRRRLEPFTTAPARLADHRGFWFLIAGGPLGVLALAGAVRGGRRLAAQMRARAESHATFVKKTIGEARTAAQKNDQAGVASAVERAVYASIEEGLGLRARAVLRDKLDLELVESGADPALADEAVKLLDVCEALRFGGKPGEDFGSIVERASSVASRMARVDRKEGRKKAA